MRNWIKSSSDPQWEVGGGYVVCICVCVCSRRINNEVVRGPQLSPRIGTHASPDLSGMSDKKDGVGGGLQREA